jgi:pyridoxal phosphate enzyme (YggS family)
MSNLEQRYRDVVARIHQAEANAGRERDSVRLLAVSKTKPLAMVEAIYAMGQRDFGENYLQDAMEKISACHQADIQWHFIGQIQSNKTRPIAEHFQWVHSVDRAKIARRLAEQRPDNMPPLQVCIQINVNDEQTKGGVDSLAEVMALAASVAEHDSLTLRGVMAIPENSDDIAIQRRNFAKVQSIFAAVQQAFPSCDTLSMGMSGDLEAAVYEGTTMVRIGTDIFGARQ